MKRQFFSYFVCAGNRGEWLADLIFRLKMAFAILTVESDFWTLNKSNLPQFLRGIMAVVIYKGQISIALGTLCSLCILKQHCSKAEAFMHFQNWIVGPENKVTLKEQEDKF